MTSTPDVPATQTGLKPDAIGFIDAWVIGLATTSPAYSLAAVIAPIVLLTGVHAPGVLVISFVPMLLIASAFYYLNTVDQDCGTTFSWVTRAMGPWFGWLGGWAIAMTGVLVIGSLAEVGVRFGLLTVGADAAADNTWLVRVLAIVLILVMTAVCVFGTEPSARLQNILIVAQVVALLVFAAVALVRVFQDTSTLEPLTPSLSWLNPLGQGGAAITGLQLLFSRTPLARAFRAVSDDREVAELMGMRADHVYALATALAMALIALAGLFQSLRTTVAPSDGPTLLLFAFESVLIGGMGSFGGPFIGAMMLGVSQQAGLLFDPGWGVWFGHVVFLAVLVVRPNGLFPKTKG